MRKFLIVFLILFLLNFIISYGYIQYFGIHGMDSDGAIASGM